MPRTAIPIQTLAKNGGFDDQITWTAGDAANNHDFENTGNELLLMKNENAAQKVAIVTSVANEYGRTGDVSLSPAAGNVTPQHAIAGPFRKPIFNSEIDKVYVGLASDTDVELAVIRYSRDG